MNGVYSFLITSSLRKPLLPETYNIQNKCMMREYKIYVWGFDTFVAYIQTF